MNWEIKFYINTLSSKVGILKLRREFPGGLMVRALHFHLGDPGLFPGGGGGLRSGKPHG